MAMFLSSCQIGNFGLIANLSLLDGNSISPGFDQTNIMIEGRPWDHKDGVLSCPYVWHGVRAGVVEISFEAYDTPHIGTIDLSEVEREFPVLHINYRMEVTIHEERDGANELRILGKAVAQSKYSGGNERESVRIITTNHLRGYDEFTSIKIGDKLATRVDLGPPQCSMWDDLPVGEYMLTYQYRDEERWAKIEILEPGGLLYIGFEGAESLNSEWVRVLEEPDWSTAEPQDVDQDLET